MLTAVAVAVSGAAIAAATLPASADTISTVPIYQLTNGSDNLNSTISNEGAPSYTLMAPRFQYEAWTFAAGSVPAGFQAIYRHYTGVDHFVSKDPAGAEALLGYLANSRALAEANSGRSCTGKSSPELRVEIARTQPVTASDDDKAAMGSGDLVESLGFAPCRVPPLT